MSLRWYLRPRLVALNPSASAQEAARAIEHNNVGAVIVQDRGRVAGIVTDRDLTVRVVGRGLDPRTTTLGEVMTMGVATLSSSDDQRDALALMQRRNVRRIPLVDGGRLVGVVTLDDLLLDEVAPIEELAAVVEAQIGEGGPAPTPRSPARMRRVARAEATYQRLLHKVRAETGLETVEQAEAALEAVLGAVVRRLTPEEADDLIAQLPSLLQPILLAQATGPDKTVSRETIEADLERRLGVDRPRAAGLAEAVGAAVAQSVSVGEMEDVQGQLPEELRRLFTAAPTSPGR